MSAIFKIPIADVRYDYCDIDSRCDKCGTVTHALGYKYDIFSENAEVTSSISATVAPTLNRIFGGRQVKVGEVPWQVNLLRETSFRPIFKFIL